MPDTLSRLRLNRFTVDLGSNVKINSFRSLSGLDFSIGVMEGDGNDGKGRRSQTVKPAFVSHPTTLSLSTQVLDPIVWSWHQEAWEGKASAMKNGSIILYDETYVEAARFNFVGGWPSSLTWSTVEAGGQESMVIDVTLEVQDIALA